VIGWTCLEHSLLAKSRQDLPNFGPIEIPDERNLQISVNMARIYFYGNFKYEKRARFSRGRASREGAEVVPRVGYRVDLTQWTGASEAAENFLQKPGAFVGAAPACRIRRNQINANRTNRSYVTYGPYLTGGMFFDF